MGEPVAQRRNSGALREEAEGGLDLGCELARGGEDEGRRPAVGLLEEALEDREEEGGGLAGARLGRADDVRPREDRGDCYSLDGRGGLVANRVDGAD